MRPRSASTPTPWPLPVSPRPQALLDAVLLEAAPRLLLLGRRGAAAAARAAALAERLAAVAGSGREVLTAVLEVFDVGARCGAGRVCGDGGYVRNARALC